MDPTTSGAAVVAPPALAEPRGDTRRSAAPDTRLYGRRLTVVRVAWAVAAIILVGLYALLFLPACLAQLQTLCSGQNCGLVQPTPESKQALQHLGFSVGSYAALLFSLMILSSLICFAVAGVIVWRKSDDWMALLVALAGVAQGAQFAPYILETGHSAWQLPAIVVDSAIWALLFLVFALFPDGRFVPGWMPWLVIGWVGASSVLAVMYVVTGTFHFTVYGFIWLIGVGSAGAAQIYRYRTVSGPLERAQTRWVVFGVTAGVLLVVTVDAPTFLFVQLGRPGSIYRLLSALAYSIPPALVSVCIGVAILRHRLYDIDVIIRRTIIYGIVTGTLGATFAICAIVLQAAFYALTRQGSALAVVGSTLAIAALFQPVRGRVQVAVDRRFYRSTYDAARIVAEFGATLRSEVDLAHLSDRVLQVANETMRPEHLSLWLAQPHAGDNQRPGPIERA